MPRVEIIMFRDPDSATDVRVFVDGVDCTESATIEDVDPGAGYERGEYEAVTDELELMPHGDDGTLSPAARAVLVQWRRDAAESSPYIT